MKIMKESGKERRGRRRWRKRRNIKKKDKRVHGRKQMDRVTVT